MLSSREYAESESVFIYVSTPTEPDTHKIINHALSSGKKVYVPKCCEGNTMLAVRINSLSELSEGKFGLYEPLNITETLEASALDMAVVPCMSAAKSLKRLGHGGGYYDRFFSETKTKMLCLCFEKLLSKEIPTDEYDIMMNKVITEEGIYE